MLKTNYGSIVNADQHIICNTVSCNGENHNETTNHVFTMYPVAYNHYKEACNFRSLSDLIGTAQNVKISNRKYISNLFVSLTSKPGHESLNIAMFTKAFLDVVHFANLNALSIAVSWKLGDTQMSDELWEKVVDVIENIANRYSHLQVVIYKI